jgi:peptidoglycan/xylan/chitin deacetylase (PgdA/CDA1 family)
MTPESNAREFEINTAAVVKRRRLLALGTLATSISAVTTLGAGAAHAASGDVTQPTAYVPVTEKGMPTGVATLDDNAKIPSNQLPNLSATYAPGGLAPTSAKPRKPLLSNMITTFAPGHGWYSYHGAAAFSANDTTDYALGTQSTRLISDTRNTPAIMRSPKLAIDATSKQFVVWVKVEGTANLTEMNLYAGDASLANHYNWTIADGGGVAQHVFREGEWAQVVLGFADAYVVGTPSRSAIVQLQFRIRASAGNAVTAHLGGIGLSAELPVFPKGVVSITCDDSYLSQFTHLKTALDRYGWGATAYTIVDRLGVQGFMTIEQLKELERVHGWEIGGHSYTMARHGIGYGNMTDAEVEADVKLLKTWLVDNNFIGADHMAYPLGSYSPACQAIIGKYFATGRTVTSRLVETLRPSDRMRLRSLSMSNTIALSTAKALVDRVAAQKGWGILTFHDIVATPTVGTHWSVANTLALIDYIATKDVVVMNVGDVTARLATN